MSPGLVETTALSVIVAAAMHMPRSCGVLLVLTVALAAALPTSDPETRRNLTIYHVNPATYGSAPINMDTGDARGDMFFEFRSKGLALECAADPSAHDCTNQEVTASDLVITKLVLDVALPLGVYGKCNICVCNHTTAEVIPLRPVPTYDSRYSAQTVTGPTIARRASTSVTAPTGAKRDRSHVAPRC